MNDLPYFEAEEVVLSRFDASGALVESKIMASSDTLYRTFNLSSVGRIRGRAYSLGFFNISPGDPASTIPPGGRLEIEWRPA